jgi:hypothetical protein
MLRKFIPHSGMVSDGCLAMDPANEEIIQGVYKRTIRDGEERLMLAVLENAVEYFQKYVLARKPSGKQLFREAEEWFLDKESEALYSFEHLRHSRLPPRPHTEGVDGLEGSEDQAKFR